MPRKTQSKVRGISWNRADPPPHCKTSGQGPEDQGIPRGLAAWEHLHKGPGAGPGVSEGGHSRPTGERALVCEGHGLLSGPDFCSERWAAFGRFGAETRTEPLPGWLCGGRVVAGPLLAQPLWGSWDAESGATGIPLSGPRDPGSLLGSHSACGSSNMDGSKDCEFTRTTASLKPLTGSRVPFSQAVLPPFLPAGLLRRGG